MTGVFIRGRRRKIRQTEEVEAVGRQSLTEERRSHEPRNACQRHQKLREEEGILPWNLLRDRGSASTWVSDFWPPEL